MERSPWERGRWHGGGRPPWWPENEAFPPPGWRRPHVFRRRFAVFMFVAALAFAIFLAFLVYVIVQAFTLVVGSPPPAFVMVIGGIFLFFTLTAGARRAQRLARPVGDLIEAAERVEHGDYAARVTPHGPRALRSLAGAFNAMSARLERSETERRRLLADVTHELRTPLTVVQGNIEALIDGVHPADEAHLRAILDETLVISRLIDDLRTISVAEAGALALHRETVDVADLARDVVASFEISAAAQGVALTVDAASAVTMEVDPIRVREIISNIVANALRYTRRGGSVRVTVTPSERDVAVSVSDDGEGIAADVLPHIFDRFTRSPQSPGAGLGLAIARSLVTAHGGTIDATSAPGQGTTIRFTLPRA